MQQSGFLSKLYQIKPFKVVQSPETIKKQFSSFSRDLENNNAIPKLRNHGQSLQSQNIFSESSSANSSLPGYSVKTQTNVMPKYSTPSRQHFPLLQSQQNLPPPQAQPADSSKKMVRKYSNNEVSPYRVTLPNKTSSLINALYAPTPRTPNKENKVPLQNMIESVVYTSLTSSIDTLFSKIEKIKQEFQFPLTASANKSKGKSANQKQKLNNSKNNARNVKYQQNHENKSQISGYSPITQGRIKQNNESSLNSLNSLLHHNQPQKIPNLQLNFLPQSQSVHSFQIFPQSTSLSLSSIPSQYSYSNGIVPVVLQNKHQNCQNNIDLFSHRTKSIIDDINMLLESSQKNNQHNNHHHNQNNSNKFKRMNTYNQNQRQSGGQNRNNKQKIENTCSQFDQFDGQFVPIKLKTTQSQYQPVLARQQSTALVCLASARSKPTKYQQPLYNGLSYKLQKPILTQQNKDIYEKQSILYQQDPYNNEMPAKLLTMREFQLGKCVGSGKFGDVHICKHKPTNLIFALKKIFKSTLKQYNMIPQFTQQLRIHYTLSNNSPNITKLYTHFQDQYHIFLLMQYIQDGTLMSYLKKQQQFVSCMISQVLDAVECLHRNNIAHRDIKPENILVTNGIAKLCDFGWSSTFKDSMRSTFCGTLDYVSPEMKDKGEYNTSVDLWSIGILAFELLAGFPPHKKQIDKWKIMGANIKNKWKWDVVFPKEFSQCAREFIGSLLKQNPDERISIRQCRRLQFITKYDKKQPQNALKHQLERVLY